MLPVHLHGGRAPEHLGGQRRTVITLLPDVTGQQAQVRLRSQLYPTMSPSKSGPQRSRRKKMEGAKQHQPIEPKGSDLADTAVTLVQVYESVERSYREASRAGTPSSTSSSTTNGA